MAAIPRERFWFSIVVAVASTLGVDALGELRNRYSSADLCRHDVVLLIPGDILPCEKIGEDSDRRERASRLPDVAATSTWSTGIPATSTDRRGAF